MLSLQILNPYGKLLPYPEDNDIKEDSQQHLGQLKPGCFLLQGTGSHISISADRQPRKYYCTGFTVVDGAESISGSFYWYRVVVIERVRRKK